MKKQLKSFAFAVLAGAVILPQLIKRQQAAIHKKWGKFAHKVRLIPHQIPQDVSIMSLTKWCLMQTKQTKQA